jgi:DNA invertase Pin-like site-specific DNA recombinase
MTAIAYLRSAPGYPLSTAEQRAAVAELARRMGLMLSRIYADGPGRGTTGRAALLRTIEEGRVSTVVTPSICRLATTWPSLLRFLGAIAKARVSLLIAGDDGQQEVEAVLAAVPTLIDIRATLHREAAAVGRARARSKGVRFGRPRIAEAKIVRLREALEAGAGVREAARQAGVSPASVVRMSQRGLNEPSPATG